MYSYPPNHLLMITVMNKGFGVITEDETVQTWPRCWNCIECVTYLKNNIKICNNAHCSLSLSFGPNIYLVHTVYPNLTNICPFKIVQAVTFLCVHFICFCWDLEYSRVFTVFKLRGYVCCYLVFIINWPLWHNMLYFAARAWHPHPDWWQLHPHLLRSGRPRVETKIKKYYTTMPQQVLDIISF